MNPYSMLGSGNGTRAAALGARLATWHDAMVTHERKIRAGRAAAMCDEECPHAEARVLWVEASEVLGGRAQELTFLRSRARVAGESSEELAASGGVLPEEADRGRRSQDSGHEAVARGSRVSVSASELSRTATAEL